MSNDPLNLLQDSQTRSQYIETINVYPRVISDSESGGSMSLVLPKKRAYLSSSSRLILPCTVPNKGYQLVPSAGIFGLIDSCTLRSETSGIIAQANHANELYSMLNNLTPPERRANRDSVHHGISYTFESGSGSKLDSNPDNREVLAGQMRLKGDAYAELSPAPVVGYDNCKPNCVSTVNDLQLEKDFADTPEFSLTLGDLLPGLFRSNFQFPLALLGEEIILDINFSKNAEFGNNDRCVFCPATADKDTESAVISLAVKELGEGHTDDASDVNVILSPRTDNPGSGTGLRIMIDFDADQVPENIRILDSGTGYKADDLIHFGLDDWGSHLIVQPSHNASDWEYPFNLVVVAGGADFVEGTEYSVYNPANDALAFKVTASSVDAGELKEVTITAVTNDNLCLPNGTTSPLLVFASDGSDSGARLIAPAQVATVTTTGGTGNLAVGDALFKNDSDPETVLAYVASVDGSSNPTSLYITTKSTIVVGTQLDKDDTHYFTVDTITVTYDFVYKCNGLGFDPVHSFDTVSGGKVNIETGKVFLASDLCYYLDGKTENDLEKMQKEGFPMLYTQFVDVVSTLSQDDEITEYGVDKVQQYSRQIGFSNEVLRNLMFAVSPAGTQNKSEFGYYGKPKLNPLLNKFCSMCSLKEDGVELQVNINSLPYYSSPIATDQRMATELSKCHGSFYLPKAVYSGWDACRQLDDVANAMTNANPSKQPGYSTLTSPTIPTRQFELNDRKMGVTNQLWQGISQKWLNGMGHYNGCSFKYMEDPSQPMNGAVVGNQAVDIRYNHTATFNPYYGGSARMMLFGEVERRLLIQNGVITVTTASF